MHDASTGEQTMPSLEITFEPYGLQAVTLTCEYEVHAGEAPTRECPGEPGGVELLSVLDDRGTDIMPAMMNAELNYIEELFEDELGDLEDDV